MTRSRRGLSVFSGRWMVASTYRPGSAPRPAATQGGLHDRIAGEGDLAVRDPVMAGCHGVAGGGAMQVGVQAGRPGYLALSHPTSDVQQDQVTAMVARLNDLVEEKVTTRDRDQVARFFAGLELVEPGLVNVSEWRPDAGPAEAPAALWVCVARKP
jgi:hypothetical protein